MEADTDNEPFLRERQKRQRTNRQPGQIEDGKNDRDDHDAAVPRF